MAEELKYDLDLHCQMIMDDYRERKPLYEKMKEIIVPRLLTLVKSNGLMVDAVEARVKKEKSLAGKLTLKGHKYASLDDITDILGVRVILFYADDVDKVASYVGKVFDVDWDNSVDKRKMHELDSFGYLSLHYVCRIPKEMYEDAAHPELNEIRFEIQMRSALQHVWASMEHDTGYKSDIECPREYLRMLSRLAGMLEMADDEFVRIKNGIATYRRKVESLMQKGEFESIPLDGDGFKSYLSLRPFDALTNRIASINQAEVREMPMMPMLPLLKEMGMQTIGDLERFLRENEEDAYNLALNQLADTDIDILASTVSLQNLIIVAHLKNGGGKRALKHVYDVLNGESPHNERLAEMQYDVARKLAFMNK